MKIKEKIDSFLSGSESQEISGNTLKSKEEDVSKEKKVIVEKELPQVDEVVDDNPGSIFEAILSEGWLEKELEEYGSPDPYTLIKPKYSDYHWLIDYRTKMISPVRYSSEVIPTVALDDDTFVCWVGSAQYIIASSLLKETGEN